MTNRIFIIAILLTATLTLISCSKTTYETAHFNLDSTAFTMRREIKDKQLQYYLCAVDLEKKNIVYDIPMAYRFRYLTIDPKDKLLYLSRTKSDWQVTYDVERLDLNKGQFLKPIRTKHYGPTQVYPSKKEVVVVEGGDIISDSLALRLYNKKNRKMIKEKELTPHGDNGQELLKTNKGTLLITENKSNNGPDNIFIYEIHPDTLTIEKKIAVQDKKSLSILYGIAYNESKGIIYLGPSSIYNGTKNEQANTNIYAYSYPDLKLLHTIKTPGQPSSYRYVKHVNKLYVNHDKGFSVVDCNTHKIIKHFPFATFKMEYVGQNILLLSRLALDWEQDEHGTWKAKRTKRSLLFFDVASDSIIKEIPGDFGPISKRYDL